MLTAIIALIASLIIFLDNKYMPSEDVFESKKDFYKMYFYINLLYGNMLKMI